EISVNSRSFGFSVMSEVVASEPADSSSSMSPAACRMISARPPLLASSGIAIRAPSGRSSSESTVAENTPQLLTKVLKTGTRSALFSTSKVERYMTCWKALPSMDPPTTSVLGSTQSSRLTHSTSRPFSPATSAIVSLVVESSSVASVRLRRSPAASASSPLFPRTTMMLTTPATSAAASPPEMAAIVDFLRLALCAREARSSDWSVFVSLTVVSSFHDRERGRGSATLPVPRSLRKEGVDGSGEVVAAVDAGDDVGIVDVLRSRTAAQELLDRPQCERGGCGDRAGQLSRRLVDVGLDQTREPGGICLLSGDPLASQHEPHHPGLAQQPDEAPQGPGRQRVAQCAGDRHPEGCRRRHEAQVRARRDAQAAAHAVPVDDGDDGNLDGAQAVEDPRDPLLVGDSSEERRVGKECGV